MRAKEYCDGTRRIKWMDGWMDDDVEFIMYRTVNLTVWDE